jgi:hypothetical protein
MATNLKNTGSNSLWRCPVRGEKSECSLFLNGLDRNHVAHELRVPAHMLLLVEEGRFVGSVFRGGVPEDVARREPAVAFAATTGRTVGPAAPVDTVLATMLATGTAAGRRWRGRRAPGAPLCQAPSRRGLQRHGCCRRHVVAEAADPQMKRVRPCDD